MPADRSSAGGDIYDEELYGLVAELSRNTKNVVLILDACHSGAATKAIDPNLHVKEVPPVQLRRSVPLSPKRSEGAPLGLGFFRLLAVWCG